MVNYLFSQIKKDTGFSDVQKEYILKNIKSGMNIAFIASVPDNHERTDEQVSRFTNMFSKIEIEFNNVNFIDSRKTKEEAQSIIKESDIVFLTGGSPELQMIFINEYELTELIQSTKIVIGVSAGSMNQGSRVIYKDEYCNYELKDYQGLNLTDINIIPHYDTNDQEVMDEVEEVSKMHQLVCLPNPSFIYIENGNKEIVGDYYQTDLNKQLKK